MAMQVEHQGRKHRATMATEVGRPGARLEIGATDDELAQLAKALAHPARVALVRHLLQQGERVCTDLSDVVPLAHSTVMQHLKVLRESGLLSSTRGGRNVLYCVNPTVLDRLKALIGEL